MDEATALDRPRDVASEYPQRRWILRRPHVEARDPLAVAAPVLDVMFLLADDVFEPLQLDAEIGWLDLEYGILQGFAPAMEWRLSRRAQPAGRQWDAWPVAETVAQVERVDRAAAERFVARACDQEAEAGADAVACPALLVFTAVRARVLEPVADDVEAIRLLRDVGPGSVDIERDERGSWVSGPIDGFVTAPVAIRAHLDRAELEVHVEAYWTPWSEEGRPGTAKVEAAVARAVAGGWKVEE